MNPRKRRASTITVVLIVAAIAATVGIGALLFGSGNGASTASADAFTVKRGDFDITVPASGELAAMDQAGREAWAEARLAGREPPAWQLAVLRKRLEEFRLASDGHGDWDRDEAWISRPHHAG